MKSCSFSEFFRILGVAKKHHALKRSVQKSATWYFIWKSERKPNRNSFPTARVQRKKPKTKITRVASRKTLFYSHIGRLYLLVSSGTKIMWLLVSWWCLVLPWKVFHSLLVHDNKISGSHTKKISSTFSITLVRTNKYTTCNSESQKIVNLRK
jgi:hypothetical protein